MMIIWLICFLPFVVFSEESSRLRSAVANPTDEGYPGRNARLNDLYFGVTAATTNGDNNGDSSKELSLQLTELHKFKTIGVLNAPWNDNWGRTFKDASIWVGSDKSYLSPLLTECIFDLNDSSLQTLPTHCAEIQVLTLVILSIT